jgi:prepilin-type processing-associated H-X9-DG protein/prepilin-type N-terminal cleavage/methylation domain-containing protein
MATQRTPRRARQAFTLVELLVVIGIIGLLIAILLPALSSARQHANQAACSSNLRQMGLAMSLYVNEWGYYPGARWQTSSSVPSQSGGPFAVWPTRLRFYMNGSQKVFLCPSQPSDTFSWPVGMTSGVVAGPSDTGFGYKLGETLLMENLSNNTGYFSYGYNDWGAYDEGNTPTVVNNSGVQRGLGGDLWQVAPYNMGPNYSSSCPGAPSGELKATMVKRPFLMIMIADVTPKVNLGAQYNFNLDPRNPLEVPGTIHNGGANVLYGDGHVVLKMPKELVMYNVTTGVKYLYGTNLWNTYSPQWNNDNLP